MEPSKKDEAMEAELIRVFGHDRRVSIQADRCVPPPVGCSGPATQFRDELSRREFAISGLCQKCQDEIFNPQKGEHYED